MYESSTKETSGRASNLLAHEDLGQFEEAHHWNIQDTFYNVKFPLVYESDNMRPPLLKKLHQIFLFPCRNEKDYKDPDKDPVSVSKPAYLG